MTSRAGQAAEPPAVRQLDAASEARASLAIADPTVGPARQLTRREACAFEDYEATIATGLASFIRVGAALAAIRDEKLYRASYLTFEEYVRRRWGLGRAHAYRQIQAAQVAKLVSPFGEVALTESALRELAPLRNHPEKLAEAWENVCARYGTSPTARQVRQVVDSIIQRTAASRNDDGQQVRRLALAAKRSLRSLQALEAVSSSLDARRRRELASSLRPLATELLRMIRQLERDE